MATVSRSAFIGVAIVAACSLLAHLLLFRQYVNGPPFVVIMRPAADGGATVQFIQPQNHGRTTASPEFHVDVELQAPFIESLNSGDVEIPGAIAELGDTTILPGAFYLRFGKEEMHVMSSRVNWKGVDYYWAEANGADAVPTASDGFRAVEPDFFQIVASGHSYYY
jgi:hypothetical protein